MKDEEETVAESIANASAVVPASRVDTSRDGTVVQFPEPVMPVPAVVGQAIRPQ